MYTIQYFIQLIAYVTTNNSLVCHIFKNQHSALITLQ